MLLDDFPGGRVASLPKKLVISGVIVSNMGQDGELHTSREWQCCHHAHNRLSLESSAL